MTSPRTLLKAWDLRARRALGQNFLSDPSTARMIVERAGIESNHSVLEIGAGLGALTIPAALAAQRLWAVEPDSRMLPLLRAEVALAGLANVTVLAASILKIDIPDLARESGSRLVVLGNLPYNISSQILVRLIECRGAVDRAVVMLQRELAERIIAPPGAKPYGRISVILQYCAELRPLAVVSAALFFPKPNVDSTVLEIRFKAQPEHVPQDEPFLFGVIKAAFGQRRKILKNALAGSSLGVDPAAAATALDQAGIEASRRAETLTVSEFVKLSDRLMAVRGARLSLPSGPREC